MRRLLLITSFLFFLGCNCIFAQRHFEGTRIPAEKIYDSKLKTYLKKFELYSLDVQELSKLLSDNIDGTKITLKFGDTSFDLDIFKNEIRAKNYQISYNSTEVLNSPDLSECYTFSGYANGNPNNYIRLFVKDSRIKGYIKYDDNMLLIDQLSSLSIGKEFKDNYIITFNGDDIIDDGSFCGVSDVMEAKFKSEHDKINIQENAKSSTCNMFGEIATDADFEFYQMYGASANNEILAVINMVDGVYTDTYGLHLFVTYQNVWTTSSDPYTGDPTTDPGSETLVGELRDYWEANKASVDRDIVHLFSGRGYTSSGVAGRVFEIGTVCRYRDRSYGFTRVRVDYFTTTAHEIGHNFSGLHTDGANCGTSTASIMCQGFKEIPMHFSSAEITRISGHLSTFNSCLRPYINVPHGPVCSATVFYIMGAPSGASVSWSASPTGIVTLSPSGHSVTVTPIGSATNSVTLTANVTTSCGSYSPTMNIHLGPPNGSLLKVGGDASLSLSSNEGNYEALYNFIPLCGSTVPPVNIQEVQWSVSTGETVYPYGSSYCTGPVVTGAGAVIYFSPGTRYVYTRAKNACGWSGLSSGFMVDVSAWFTVVIAPNPADSYISVQLRDDPSKSNDRIKPNEVFEVKLFNERGKLLRNASSEGGVVKFDTKQLPEGTFFLHVKRGEEVIKRQIKITH